MDALPLLRHHHITVCHENLGIYNVHYLINFVLDVFIKLNRNPFVTAAIYFRYHIPTGSALLFYCGTETRAITRRIDQVLKHASSSNPNALRDPFAVLSIIYDELTFEMEMRRRGLDIAVRKHEGRTGMTAHRADPTQLADNYHDQIKELSREKSFVQFFEHSIEYHTKLGEFLLTSREALKSIMHAKIRAHEDWECDDPSSDGYARNGYARNRYRSDRFNAEQKVEEMLKLNLNLSSNASRQVRGLLSRIDAQITLVCVLSTFPHPFCYCCQPEPDTIAVRYSRIPVIRTGSAHKRHWRHTLGFQSHHSARRQNQYSDRQGFGHHGHRLEAR